MSEEKTKPVHEIRVGRIKAAIWRNETKTGELYNVTFTRLYRVPEEKREKKKGSKDNGWRRSDSFGRDDLLLLAKVADMAQSYIFEQNGSASNDEA